MAELPYRMLSLISVIILAASVYNGVGQPQIDTFKEKPDRCYDTNELAEFQRSVYQSVGFSLYSYRFSNFTRLNEKNARLRFLERRCCIFPPFFDQVSARACGASLYLISTDDRLNITHIRRDMFGGTDYWHCILTKYKLLDDEDKLVHDKYYSHLDKWASLNPEFSAVITTAKMFCLNMFRSQMPLEIIGFFEFQNCIRNYVKLDCPVLIQSQECLEWKEFYDECREFYI